jgi:hypothetical protein
VLLDKRFLCAALAVTLSLFAAACGGDSSPEPPNPPLAQLTPLNDLGQGTYLGFTGGLYSNGSNSVPAAHHAAGLARANAVQPLDVNGTPSPSGKIVLLSIGMSNTTQEFCSANSDLPCNPWTFMGQAATDSAVNRLTLAIVNGAMGGRTTAYWDSPSDADYDRIRDTRLAPQGLDERQVQIAWVKVANAQPAISLPSAQSDGVLLVTQIGNILRALKVRYPNLKLAFLSSRIYAGYATTALNPEPYAYESGFAVKWVIQAQIDQMQNAGTVVDQRAGDLNYNTMAPWVAWGPYLWARGTTPRSDGLTWEQADLESDGTHPAQSGEQKVGTLLLSFFKNSAYTKCWFVSGGSCP